MREPYTCGALVNRKAKRGVKRGIECGISIDIFVCVCLRVICIGEFMPVNKRRTYGCFSEACVVQLAPYLI